MKKSRRIAGADPEIQVDFSGRVTPESAHKGLPKRRESVSSSSESDYEMAPTPAETAASKMEIRATARKDALAQAVTQLETYVTSYEGATGDDKIIYLAKARRDGLEQAVTQMQDFVTAYEGAIGDETTKSIIWPKLDWKNLPKYQIKR